LTKAESSLTSLEQSFAACRQTVELQITRLEKARGGWRIAFWAACGAALAGTITAAVMGRGNCGFPPLQISLLENILFA
jgi:hypothetical protein